MKTTVLYHDDADGFGAAYIIWEQYGDKATYIPVQYGQPVPEIPKETETLFIVDFSYDRQTCEALADKYMVRIIDHHKTAEETLSDLPFATFSSDLSGCGLTWNHFHYNKPMPEMLQYIQDRDLWKFKLPYSEEVNLVIHSLDKDFSLWQSRMRNWDLNEMVVIGSILQRFRQHQIDSCIKHARWMSFFGFEVPVVNCSTNISEVGNDLCRMYPDAEFSASYCDRDDVRSWSLRSRGEFDVSELAKQMGGGGHKNAAGFSSLIGWPGGPWPEVTPKEFTKVFEKLTEE
jgi:oligoribonuclease NrnB/cAMP/cGMP phosphodiesterase (DHH superfamily)